MIRLAKNDDLAALPAIERAAGARFLDVGMEDIADGGTADADDLQQAHDAGQLWVAEEEGRLRGFLFASVIDGSGHLDEVSVHPDAAGRGLGAQLIDAFLDWARARGFAAATLTTFELVPWNAPYYERLGFTVWPSEFWSTGLRRQVDAEARAGLDPQSRVVMRYPLEPTS